MLPLGELAGVADVVVEAAPPALFMDVALPAAEAPSPFPQPRATLMAITVALCRGWWRQHGAGG